MVVPGTALVTLGVALVRVVAAVVGEAIRARHARVVGDVVVLRSQQPYHAH